MDEVDGPMRWESRDDSFVVLDGMGLATGAPPIAFELAQLQSEAQDLELRIGRSVRLAHVSYLCIPIDDLCSCHVQ